MKHLEAIMAIALSNYPTINLEAVSFFLGWSGKCGYFEVHPVSNGLIPDPKRSQGYETRRKPFTPAIGPVGCRAFLNDLWHLNLENSMLGKLLQHKDMAKYRFLKKLISKDGMMPDKKEAW